MGNLTDIQIRNWKKAGKPLAKADGDGLTFTLSSAGTASWILRYRHGGKQKELTLGRYPDIGLSEARKLATEHRAKVQQGLDVGREKQKAKTKAAKDQSFKQLAEDYMSKVFPTLAPNTVKQRKQHITKVINPKIGAITARDVEPADIVSLVEQVGKNSINVAELVLTAISEICKHGVAKRVLDTNPAAGISVKAICGKAEPKRTRLKLTDAELRALLPELPSIGKENALAVKILLATCVRIGELARAKWEHVDFEKRLWLVPDTNSKTGKGFTVPLAPAVIGWFKELQELACGSAFVLPARQQRRVQTYGKEVYFEQRALNAMLVKLCERTENIRRFTPHDLRSTARSHLAELGVDVIVAERCLNHSLGGLLAIYDQHDYLDERRMALELWTEYLLSCEQGRKWNVVTLDQNNRKRA